MRDVIKLLRLIQKMILEWRQEVKRKKKKGWGFGYMIGTNDLWPHEIRDRDGCGCDKQWEEILVCQMDGIVISSSE